MSTQPLHKDRKQYVTVEEAQIIINRSERTIRRWIEKQRVHVIRDASGYVRIDLDDLEQVREQQPLTIHPVQQRIQSYDSQIAAVEGVPTFLPPVFPAKDSSRRFCLVFSPLSLEQMGFLSHPRPFH